MKYSKELNQLISILDKCNIVYLPEWEQKTISGHTIVYVAINKSTWTFQCDEKGYWQYEFGAIMYSLNDENEYILLSERTKSLKK